MRKVSLTVLALITFYLLATPLALGQGKKTGKAKGGNVEEQIKALQEEFRQAQLKGDISALEKFYADDAMTVHSDGKLTTKAQEIANFKSGSEKAESMTMNEQRIHTYGDTAVANGEYSVTATVHGKQYTGNVSITRVWVKEKGGWKVVLYQATRIAPASQ
jgi:uncharacterized protein (TIGR02246 family)